MIMAMYDWIPFYKELADILLQMYITSNKSRQWFINFLNGCVNSIGEISLPHNGTTITTDCDAITFFLWLHNYGIDKIKKILTNAKQVFKLQSNIPTDYSGIPGTNPRNVVPIDLSKTKEVDMMWDLFESAMNYPNDIPLFENNFDKVNKISGPTGKKIKSISGALFMIRPDVFCPLCGNMLNYINQNIQNKIETPNNAQEYMNLIDKVKTEIINNNSNSINSFAQLSYESTTNAKKYSNNSLSGGIVNMESYKKMLFENKNVILCGPPGTGKTYNAVHLAVAMIKDEYKIDEKFNVIDDKGNQVSHDDLLREFNNELSNNDNGHIQFITFHQSYGYEEFIEGIKPVITEEENVIYKIEDGIFKEFCERTKGVDIFEQQYQNLLSDVDNGNYNGISGMKDITCSSSIIILQRNSKDNFNFQTKNEYDKNKKIDASMNTYRSSGTITKEKLKIVYNGGKLDYHQTYYKAVVEYMKTLTKNNVLNSTIVEESSKKKRVDNYVFIIDEINRGNISKIFGELITLIEKTKRNGAAEEMSVMLPYSKFTFSVPNNVYIIGTMNTADRSISLIDTALRRRFKFIEMMPNPDLIDTKEIKSKDGKTININYILETMNKRIEYLFDREHTIGHSYFIKIKNISDLDNVMRNEIIPLLQEYFYEDYKKIRMILGDNQKEDDIKVFIKEIDEKEKLFGEEGIDFIDEEKQMYEINDEQFTDYDFYKYLQ